MSVSDYSGYIRNTTKQKNDTKADGTDRNLNYIYAGGSLVAIYEQKATGDTLHYVFTDYLGSLKCITDQDGNTEQRLSYDAWGNRRNYVDGGLLTAPPANLLFARGYTGHEHLDEFGLINMNGRVYDPALGLFLSPDKYVQVPNNTQNFNRYTYCLNNPLMYSDPTGDFFIIPGISWSPQGGFGISISAGIGLNNILSAQLTVGYDFGSHNLYGSLGVTAAGFANAYVGYGTQSGWFAGAGISLGSSAGNYASLSSNMLSAGFNYSQSGGWSANISSLQYNTSGFSFSASVSFSYHEDPNSRKKIAERRCKANIAAAFDRYEEKRQEEIQTKSQDGQVDAVDKVYSPDDYDHPNVQNDYKGVKGLSIGYSNITYSNGYQGEVLYINYSSPEITADARWVQVIYTNFPTCNRTSPYFDNIPYQNLNTTCIPNNNTNYAGPQKTGAGESSFYDRPARPISKDSNWMGVLMLWQNNHSILNITYGFSITNGKIRIYTPNIYK